MVGACKKSGGTLCIQVSWSEVRRMRVITHRNNDNISITPDTTESILWLAWHKLKNKQRNDPVDLVFISSHYTSSLLPALDSLFLNDG